MRDLLCRALERRLVVVSASVRAGRCPATIAATEVRLTSARGGITPRLISLRTRLLCSRCLDFSVTVLTATVVTASTGASYLCGGITQCGTDLFDIELE